MNDRINSQVNLVGEIHEKSSEHHHNFKNNLQYRTSVLLGAIAGVLYVVRGGRRDRHGGRDSCETDWQCQ